MKTAAEVALDYLDGANHGANAINLAADRPEFTFEDYKEALAQLHQSGQIQRLPVKGINGKIFYTFFSLYYRTVEGYATREPEPVKPVLSEEQAQRVMARLEQELQPSGTVTLNLPAMPPEVERVEIVREVVREVPVGKVKPARFGIMDVIDRWKLNFRLSRIIEVVGSARNRKLTKADAVMVCRMINEHVSEQEAVNG